MRKFIKILPQSSKLNQKGRSNSSSGPRVSNLMLALGLGAMSLGLVVNHTYGDSFRYPVQVGLASLSIARPAALGLGGIKTYSEESHVSDLHRKRLARNQFLPVEVKNVNDVCDQYGIPLTEELADLFILHHAVNPVAGSPCDASFEAMIKNKFDEECSMGFSSQDASKISADMSIKERQGIFLSDQRNQEIKAYNKAGYISHSLYQAAKKFKFSLVAYGPSPVHKERYMLNDNLTYPCQAFFNQEFEIYIFPIEHALKNIKLQVEHERELKGWEPYCQEENDFRDALVLVEAQKIKLIQSQFSKTIQQGYKSTIRSARESTDQILASDEKRTSPKK